VPTLLGQGKVRVDTTYLIVYSIGYPDKVSASVSVITILKKIKTMSLTATSTSPLQLPFTTSNGNYLQRNDFGAVGTSRFLSSKTKGSPLIRYSFQYFVLCVLSLSKIDWILRNLWEVVTGFRNLRQITRGSERKTWTFLSLSSKFHGKTVRCLSSFSFCILLKL
jgi:hypothetical protein